MKDVEVGHCGSDAVEFVHQPRLGIVEELGAHKAWRVRRFACPRHHKKSVNFCLDLRFAKTLTTNKKAHGYTVSVLLSCSGDVNYPDFRPLEKQKRFYMFLIFNYLYL